MPLKLVDRKVKVKGKDAELTFTFSGKLSPKEMDEIGLLQRSTYIMAYRLNKSLGELIKDLTKGLSNPVWRSADFWADRLCKLARFTGSLFGIRIKEVTFSRDGKMMYVRLETPDTVIKPVKDVDVRKELESKIREYFTIPTVVITQYPSQTRAGTTELFYVLPGFENPFWENRWLHAWAIKDAVIQLEKAKDPKAGPWTPISDMVPAIPQPIQMGIGIKSIEDFFAKYIAPTLDKIGKALSELSRMIMVNLDRLKGVISKPMPCLVPVTFREVGTWYVRAKLFIPGKGDLAYSEPVKVVVQPPQKPPFKLKVELALQPSEVVAGDYATAIVRAYVIDESGNKVPLSDRCEIDLYVMDGGGERILRREWDDGSLLKWKGTWTEPPFGVMTFTFKAKYEGSYRLVAKVIYKNYLFQSNVAELRVLPKEFREIKASISPEDATCYVGEELEYLASAINVPMSLLPPAIHGRLIAEYLVDGEVKGNFELEPECTEGMCKLRGKFKVSFEEPGYHEIAWRFKLREGEIGAKTTLNVYLPPKVYVLLKAPEKVAQYSEVSLRAFVGYEVTHVPGARIPPLAPLKGVEVVFKAEEVGGAGREFVIGRATTGEDGWAEVSYIFEETGRYRVWAEARGVSSDKVEVEVEPGKATLSFTVTVNGKASESVIAGATVKLEGFMKAVFPSQTYAERFLNALENARFWFTVGGYEISPEDVRFNRGVEAGKWFVTADMVLHYKISSIGSFDVQAHAYVPGFGAFSSGKATLNVERLWLECWTWPEGRVAPKQVLTLYVNGPPNTTFKLFITRDGEKVWPRGSPYMEYLLDEYGKWEGSFTLGTPGATYTFYCFIGRSWEEASARCSVSVKTTTADFGLYVEPTVVQPGEEVKVYVWYSGEGDPKATAIVEIYDTNLKRIAKFTGRLEYKEGVTIRGEAWSGYIWIGSFRPSRTGLYYVCGLVSTPYEVKWTKPKCVEVRCMRYLSLGSPVPEALQEAVAFPELARTFPIHVTMDEVASMYPEVSVVSAREAVTAVEATTMLRMPIIGKITGLAMAILSATAMAMEYAYAHPVMSRTILDYVEGTAQAVEEAEKLNLVFQETLDKYLRDVEEAGRLQQEAMRAEAEGRHGDAERLGRRARETGGRPGDPNDPKWSKIMDWFKRWWNWWKKNYKYVLAIPLLIGGVGTLLYTLYVGSAVILASLWITDVRAELGINRDAKGAERPVDVSVSYGRRMDPSSVLSVGRKEGFVITLPPFTLFEVDGEVTFALPVIPFFIGPEINLDYGSSTPRALQITRLRTKDAPDGFRTWAGLRLGMLFRLFLPAITIPGVETPISAVLRPGIRFAVWIVYAPEWASYSHPLFYSRLSIRSIDWWIEDLRIRTFSDTYEIEDVRKPVEKHGKKIWVGGGEQLWISGKVVGRYYVQLVKPMEGLKFKVCYGGECKYKDAPQGWVEDIAPPRMVTLNAGWKHPVEINSTRRGLTISPRTGEIEEATWTYITTPEGTPVPASVPTGAPPEAVAEFKEVEIRAPEEPSGRRVKHRLYITLRETLGYVFIMGYGAWTQLSPTTYYAIDVEVLGLAEPILQFGILTLPATVTLGKEPVIVKEGYTFRQISSVMLSQGSVSPPNGYYAVRLANPVPGHRYMLKATLSLAWGDVTSTGVTNIWPGAPYIFVEGPQTKYEVTGNGFKAVVEKGYVEVGPDVDEIFLVFRITVPDVGATVTQAGAMYKNFGKLTFEYEDLDVPGRSYKDTVSVYLIPHRKVSE